MFLIYFCLNFEQIFKMSLSLLETLFWRACNLEINWTSTRQRKQGYISDLSLNGTLEMTGKQHVIEKTMIIIIIQQKIFSMFLLQDPSSELAKWRGSENWKYYYFLNSLHCCRRKALEKSISSMLVYICGQEDSILLTNFLACHEEEKQNKEEKMSKFSRTLL